MSDREDDQEKSQEEPDNEKTLIRGQGETSSVPNNDETILRDTGKPKSPAPDERNDDATLLRRVKPQSPEGGADATVIRDKKKSVPEEAAPADATVIRDKKKSAPEEAAPADSAGNPDATILRSRSTVTSDAATILRAPGEDSATILGISGVGEAGSEDATVARPAATTDNDRTLINDALDDDDRTLLNDSYDDNDETLMGPDSGEEDTTYIASIGKQVKPQGNSEAGRLLKNRFVLEEKIGSGGMGDVYKALDLRQQEAQERNPYIAIKLLNENFSKHKDAFLSLQRETSRTRGIPHPNIMGVYDFDREGDTVFMSMELLDGKPLDDYLKEHPEGVSEEDAWNIIDGISQGLMRAHDAGIVHSDFKPGNIFYTKDKIAKVFDFGIARAISNPGDLEADGEKTVFDAGSLGALTPTYASYEMLKGLEPSKSDDVYAVALVAYELFMGKHPYDRIPADQAFERELKPKPIPFLKRRHWKALRKALELKSEDRTQTIDEFREGMFSADLPIFTYAAVASVLVASIGFGAYQTLNVKEKPADLIQNENIIAASKSTLNTIDKPRWDSVVWHEQLATALNRWKLAEQERLDNEQWVEEWELEHDPDMEKRTAKILEIYLKKIRDLREDAQTYDNGRQDEFGVTQAIDNLVEAKSYLDRVIANYHQSDRASVNTELERLDRRINFRDKQLADIELAERLADEAALAKQESDRIESERLAFEANRLGKYEGYLAELDDILRCKGDVSDDQVDRFGQLLTEMKSEWRDAYDFHHPTIVSYMATCIQQRIGFVDPKRAREVQAMMVSYMPGETQISGLVIEDKDPCDDRKLIGSGDRNRRWCSDYLSEGGTGPELVVIPAITVVDYKYAIGRAEIKVGEYNFYCGKVGCATLSANSSLPATNLTIDQARDYANWLTAQTGQQYRLPTVREWRYAAIARNEAKVVDENINCTVDSRGVRLGEKLLNAISGKANTFGLYNFVGNAREWALGEDEAIVALGGAHTDPRQECHLDTSVAHQGGADPVTGFRIVREIVNKDADDQKSDLAASG